MRLRLGLTSALALLCITATPTNAQEGRDPYSFDQVLQLVSAGVGTPLILTQIEGTCISFEVDVEAESRLRAVGADSALVEGLRAACLVSPARGTARRTYSPGGAAIRSLLIPGLGQFYTERPLLGVGFLTAAAGAVVLGATSGSETVYCAQPTTGDCPSQMVIERDSGSNLILGVAGGVAIAALGAVEAYFAAQRRNDLGEMSAGAYSTGDSLEFLPTIDIGLGGTLLMGGRVTF